MTTSLCEDGLRLLDAYHAALSAFHDARRYYRQSDTEWSKLVAARRAYLEHIERHGCRETRQTTASATNEATA